MLLDPKRLRPDDKTGYSGFVGNTRTGEHAFIGSIPRYLSRFTITILLAEGHDSLVQVAGLLKRWDRTSNEADSKNTFLYDPGRQCTDSGGRS